MTPTETRRLTPGVRGIVAASFLADVGHEIPTALLSNLLTVTLGAPEGSGGGADDPGPPYDVGAPGIVRW